MQVKASNRSREAGFTLIELMIVVGIIGILVAIAAPNFSRYESKARQSEAKIALSAICAGEKSFQSEYQAYIGSFDAIGYSPEGAKRFYTVGWSAALSGTVTGFLGSSGNSSWTNVNNSFSCTQSTADLATGTTADAQTFIVSASGCIRNGVALMDDWNMNESKSISNNNIAL